MIKIETFTNQLDGKTLKKAYSDENLKIKKIGTEEIYDIAVDLVKSDFDYEEINEKIDK